MRGDIDVSQLKQFSNSVDLNYCSPASKVQGEKH